jgi:hypothetical protein
MGVCVPRYSADIRSSGTPFMVAFVPTGIKIGVVTLMPRSVISPTLMRQRCFSTRKSSLFFIDIYLLENKSSAVFFVIFSYYVM